MTNNQRTSPFFELLHVVRVVANSIHKVPRARRIINVSAARVGAMGNGNTILFAPGGRQSRSLAYTATEIIIAAKHSLPCPIGRLVVDTTKLATNPQQIVQMEVKP